MENRTYTRFPLKVCATIRHGGVTIVGRLVNMSLSGAFIGTTSTVAEREAVTVSILNGARSDLLNNLKATITRTSEAGCAVRFDAMLLETREARRAP